MVAHHCRGSTTTAVTVGSTRRGTREQTEGGHSRRRHHRRRSPHGRAHIRAVRRGGGQQRPAGPLGQALGRRRGARRQEGRSPGRARRCRLEGLPRRLGHQGRRPVRLGHRSPRLRQAERQEDPARRRPGPQHRRQGEAAGLPRLQPGRPRRLRAVLPGPDPGQEPAVGEGRHRLRLRGLRPARCGALGAHLLRRPAGVGQGTQGGPGPGQRGRQAGPAQARQGVRRRLPGAQR